MHFLVLFTPRASRGTILNDPFIQRYIQDLLTNIRTQVVLQAIRPFTRVRIPFIAQQLNISPAEVEGLLVNLILDNKVAGHIDQVRCRHHCVPRRIYAIHRCTMATNTCMHA